MKILVYGAGVLGSLYAARLFESGNDVRILARGKRFEEIAGDGIILENAMNHQISTTMVPVVNSLSPDDEYDVIIVLLRKDQVDEILPVLCANRVSKTILFMVNNPLGYDEWSKQVGINRIVIGFAGAGGTRQNGIVSYHIVSKMLQPTTLGSVDGSSGKTLLKLEKLFDEAGFPTTLCDNMDAWQKTHVAWVSPVAQAIYAAGGSGTALSENRPVLSTMVKAIKESLAVLDDLNIPITPSKLILLKTLPTRVLVFFMRLWARTRHFEIIATQHTLTAVDEMEVIAQEFLSLSQMTCVSTPALDMLFQALLEWKKKHSSKP